MSFTTIKNAVRRRYADEDLKYGNMFHIFMDTGVMIGLGVGVAFCVTGGFGILGAVGVVAAGGLVGGWCGLAVLGAATIARHAYDAIEERFTRTAHHVKPGMAAETTLQPSGALSQSFDATKCGPVAQMQATQAMAHKMKVV